MLHCFTDKEMLSKQFLSLNVPEISIVVVNLYPFEKIKNNINKKVTEMIDIGGPSLLRAAENFKYITPIINIDDYPKLIENINIKIQILILEKKWLIKYLKKLQSTTKL